MGKVIGGCGLFVGIIYLLYQWVMEQKARQRRIEAVIMFLQKIMVAMEEDKIRIIDYLAGYECEELLLKQTLQEIAMRLRKNIYPSGVLVWEEVFEERKHLWNMDKETYDIILAVGMGIFGKKSSENLMQLQRCLYKLERQQETKTEKDEKERKVWIPVSVLGGVMLMIILI